MTGRCEREWLNSRQQAEERGAGPKLGTPLNRGQLWALHGGSGLPSGCSGTRSGSAKPSAGLHSHTSVKGLHFL
jgi:hypothetical protein